MSPIVEFRDDDDGYLQWLTGHPNGYVINIARNYSASGARLHLASCNEIKGTKYPGKALTGSYVKRCADDVHHLMQWASETVRREIQPCGTCRPTVRFREYTATADTTLIVGEAGPAAPTHSTPVTNGRFAVFGPAVDKRHVAAWADDYIHFERRPPWQDALRAEIRSRCADLTPSAGEVLHAAYFGAKDSRTDVENLVLYNIGTFNSAGSNGIRFEHGDVVPPPSPDGREYPVGYTYSLASRESGFNDWRPDRELAAFGWTEVGNPRKTPSLAQIWLALSRNPCSTFGPPRGPTVPFALHLEVRPPRGQRPVWGGLVKSFFDGAICAYQAHTDMAVLPIVAQRIASVLGESPREIDELLLNQRHAVIGAVPLLVKPFGAGVQWQPSDQMCVAGELLAAPADEPGCVEHARWAIRGRLVELAPVANGSR
ncbi:hypothetical protein [Mycobacterium sp. SMC-4]|uniref:hypothetical protein n=1 Tax=Mycobacterium sp. SMC-4 TaxID=2857059 RepID=UPI003D08BC5A